MEKGTMKLQQISSGITAPKLGLPSTRLLPHQTGFHHIGVKTHRIQLNLRNTRNGFWLLSLKRGVIVCASSGSNSSNGVPSRRCNGEDPFSGKTGSVTFHGFTHQSMEEAKLVTAPFGKVKSSYLWVMAPSALTLSLILPQFFVVNVIEAVLKDVVLVEMASSLFLEAIFYVGLATFLLITDRIQRPYLQFSSRRLGFITGLRGYLISAIFVMGIKVVAPLFVVHATWSVLGLSALVPLLPFLVGCIAQPVFEISMYKRGLSCRPLVPIIFEVYRLYQLTKAAHFIEKLMFSMRGLPESAQVLERTSALVAMVVIIQVLGLVCLWSLMTFLLRLFPSRPAEKH
ncbi:hypothetical protein Tsubulata_023570 [Turnera subulata]|uniref:Uncharacterized protein n=1 Tax=Turnera subulata TaxID=218843 RepID=A0A9Q0JGQ4_9ROSI|nr:hypothetical protein Tsubulata_023570 [Turnera subulata]